MVVSSRSNEPPPPPPPPEPPPGSLQQAGPVRSSRRVILGKRNGRRLAKTSRAVSSTMVETPTVVHSGLAPPPLSLTTHTVSLEEDPYSIFSLSSSDVDSDSLSLDDSSTFHWTLDSHLTAPPDASADVVVELEPLDVPKKRYRVSNFVSIYFAKFDLLSFRFQDLISGCHFGSPISTSFLYMMVLVRLSISCAAAFAVLCWTPM